MLIYVDNVVYGMHSVAAMQLCRTIYDDVDSLSVSAILFLILFASAPRSFDDDDDDNVCDSFSNSFCFCSSKLPFV